MAMNLDALLRIRANVLGEEAIRRLGNSLQGLQGRAKNAARSLATISDGFRGLNGLLLGLGGGFTLAKIFGNTATLESQTRSLEVLTGSAAQAADIIGQLRSFANVTPFGSTELIETAKRLNAFGVQGQRVVEVTKRLGDVAGATGANINELATAYGQVVAKGRLQGEELLQFQERGVALQQELQKMYGLSGKELQKALEQGLIPAQAVEVAIQRLTEKGGKYANGAIAQSDTLKGKLSTLSDAFTNLAINIGKKLEPIFKFLLDRTTELINRLNSGFSGASENIRQQIGAKRLQNAGVRRTYPDAQGNVYSTITGRLVQAAKPPSMSGGGSLATPPLVPGSSSTKGSKAKEIIDITAQELDLSMMLNRAKLNGNKLVQAELVYMMTLLDLDKQKLGIRRRQQLEANYATTLLQTQVDYAKELGTSVAQDFIKRQELQEKYNRTVEDLKIKAGLITGEELKKVEINRELEAIIQRLPGLTDAQIAKLRELIQANQDVKKSFKDTFGDSLKEYYKQLTDFVTQVADSVKGAFKGLEDQLVSFVTTGKLDFADLANSIIQDIARIAIRQAIIAPLLKGVGGIFGITFANGGVFAQNGIQPFARGGIVDKPTLFPFAKGTGLMGEAGPEAIIPLRRGRDGRLGVDAGGGGSSGNINVTVNVDATGTKTQGDDGRAGQFARAISEAVKNEIVTQKRPGGLLA
jgi:lambda family phage tail tape measure protein